MISELLMKTLVNMLNFITSRNNLFVSWQHRESSISRFFFKFLLHHRFISICKKFPELFLNFHYLDSKF